MVDRHTNASFSASVVSFLMIELLDTADLQEGILLGYKKRSSEGAESKETVFLWKYLLLPDNALDRQIGSD